MQQWTQSRPASLLAQCQGIEPMIGMNYVHQTANHTENVVDQATEDHTKTIESF